MYDDVYGPNGGALLAVLGIFLFLLAFGAVIYYVLSSWFLMRIFDKAGVQGRWRAWVPVYNLMVFFKLGDLSPWLVLYSLAGSILLGFIDLGFIFGIATAVLSAMAAYRVGLKLQKEGAWVVLYIFLSLIWLGINAFDRSRWNPAVPPAPWSGNAFFGDRTVWDGVPSGTRSGLGAPDYGAAGYGQAPYGQAPYGQAPYGQAPYGQNGYGHPQQGQAPYGQSAPDAFPSAFPPPADATGGLPPRGDAPGVYPPSPAGTTPGAVPPPPRREGDDPSTPPAPPAP
ncbi:DUF5684 domain-containing protein [Microbacterium oryzae]|uniref:DUF5684 domain-containing protein n=1 Tax=Microbacterium oryzae TaxID=743009 RepID=UPI0025AEF95F|nr:DUF5684 domain-containing protein [Microbacterium oryzae]MDN3311474.1 DUF5684 domain-containing protein [Microbacterium oryzae]